MDLARLSSSLYLDLIEKVISLMRWLSKARAVEGPIGWYG